MWAYLNRIKPYLWKEGKTFPSTLATMHQMFANGELYFTMSNNDCEVDNKIAQGTFLPGQGLMCSKAVLFRTHIIWV